MTAPALQVRDAVVVAGTKYRVRAFTADGGAQLKTSFGGRERTLSPAEVGRLTYDKRVGVWRLERSAPSTRRSGRSRPAGAAL